MRTERLVGYDGMNVYVEGGSSHGRSTLKEARDCFCGEINVHPYPYPYPC